MALVHLGMRGDGDWIANQRPENWRQGILFLFPNGTAPLTAMTSMLGSEKTTDPKFHWWTKNLPDQLGAITGTFTNASLSTAYVSGAAAGDTIFAQATADGVNQFRIGHQVMFGFADTAGGNAAPDYRYNTTGEVIATVENGASSYVAVQLHQAPPFAPTQDLDDVDTLLVIGNVNSEGATMPVTLAYDPVEYDNLTQIFRTSLSITRTARETTLRTGDAYGEAKREALELHSIEMEKAFLWSTKFNGIGANKKPKRAQDGMIPWVIANAAANVDAYHLNTDFTGQSWLQGGKTWLDEFLERIFRFGNTTKMAFVGSGAMLGINALAEAFGTINLQVRAAAFGITVLEWVTPFGTLFLKTHPLFSYVDIHRYDMVIFEPSNVRTRFITDTMFKNSPGMDNTSNHGVDGTEEEFITEIGLELHHPLTFGFLTGVGKLNTV